MFSRCSPQVVLSRLTELGLSMQLLPSLPSSPTPPLASVPNTSQIQTYSPVRRKLATEIKVTCRSPVLDPLSGSPAPPKPGFSDPLNAIRCHTPTTPAFSDPLNVSQAEASPETAIAR